MSKSRFSNGDELEGFDDLSNLLNDVIKKVDETNVLNALNLGASEFVKNLLSLPKPKSKLQGPGYTHMIDVFAYKENGKQVEVGWGKYYGPMVEKGSVLMRAQPHLEPLWTKNKDSILMIMIESLNL